MISEPDDKKVNKAISTKVRSLREAAGITQKEFANSLGNVSQSYVTRLERADYSFSITLMRRICKIFDITLADFFKDLNL